MADNGPETKSTANDGGDTGSDAGKGPVRGVEAAREKLHHLADEEQRRYQRPSGDVRKGDEKASRELRRSAEVARVKVDEASENLRQGYQRAQTQAKSLQRDLNDYVQENPGRSVIAAAAVGFLVGLIFRRRGD
jgi:ElaB/YqjD/DUF883 family membrane-anchored ribosome-binding protein